MLCRDSLLGADASKLGMFDGRLRTLIYPYIIASFMVSLYIRSNTLLQSLTLSIPLSLNNPDILSRLDVGVPMVG